MAPEIEERILALCLERPTYGAQRIANELRLQNVDVSPSGVRGVWLRHELATRHQRLLRLETRAQDDTVALSDEQIRLLERHSCEFRMRHVDVSAPSYDNPLAETIIGLYKTEVIRRRGPWCHLEAVELATLEWVEWFNHRRLFEPIGDTTPAEKEEQYYLNQEWAKVA